MLDLAPHVLQILSEFDGHILLEPLNFAPPWPPGMQLA